MRIPQTCAIILSVLWLCQAALGQSDLSARYEMAGGSQLGHDAAAPGNPLCSSGEHNIVDLTGTFGFMFKVFENRVTGSLTNIDLRGTSANQKDYRVTGTGVYQETRGSASLQLFVTINEVAVTLKEEFPFTDTISFPEIRQLVFVVGATNPPGNCYILSFISRPIAEDAVKFFRRGDVDENETIGLTDAIRVLLQLFGGHEMKCEDASDVDDNGTLDTSDAIYLLNHLFLGGSAPPVPLFICGMDATPDDLECGGQETCIRK